MSATSSVEPRIYQLKITLRYIRPPIWRRVLVPGEMSLAELHLVIREVMGWLDYHLHQFEVGDVVYGMEPEEDAGWGLRSVDENAHSLEEVAPREKARFFYEYDLGDGWDHVILVEKILPREQGKRYPVCLAGKRAAPPEDSGGPYMYGEFLEALRDPKHPDHEDLVEWSGGDFDPEHFSLEEVNARLVPLQKRRRRRVTEEAGTEADIADAMAALRVPEALRARTRAIMELADQFSAEHLEMEYAYAARRVIATLARKRPSPLLTGEPRVWAAAVLQVLVATNFPFDDTRPDPAVDGARLAVLGGIAGDHLLAQGRRVTEALARRPMDAVLPPYREAIQHLALWMEDVQFGLADPEAPPPHLRMAAGRLKRLSEKVEALERESGPRLVEERPRLRLIELPQDEDESDHEGR